MTSGLCAIMVCSGVIWTVSCGGAGAQPLTPTPIAPEHVSWYGDPGAPDMSGLWTLSGAKPTMAGKPVDGKEGWQPWPPPLKDTYDSTWRSRVAAEKAGTRKDDPVLVCVRPGMPRFVTGMNGPLLIMQLHKRVMMYRDGESPRRIWMDGRNFPAPKDLEDFPKGTAIGRYQGKDLLIESRGFKDYPIDATGVPHGEDLKITEKYHRVDKQTLEVQVTLDDPQAYAQPLVTTVTYKRLNDPNWRPHEVICTPNTDYQPETYVH